MGFRLSRWPLTFDFPTGKYERLADSLGERREPVEESSSCGWQVVAKRGPEIAGLLCDPCESLVSVTPPEPVELFI